MGPRLADNDKISHKRGEWCYGAVRLFCQGRCSGARMDKRQALSTVFSAADAYKRNLSGKNLLFLSADKHLCARCSEVSFSEGNFKHLTGFRTKLAPVHFFNLCLSRRLRESDFEFAGDGTTQLKLQVLPLMVKADLSARMIGDYNGSHVKLHTDKVAGGVRASVGLERVGQMERYVPNTLLREDVRSLSRGKPDRILLTFRKDVASSEYEEVVYRAKGVDWGKVKPPCGYENLLAKAGCAKKCS